jgi:hypothetical protein
MRQLHTDAHWHLHKVRWASWLNLDERRGAPCSSNDIRAASNAGIQIGHKQDPVEHIQPLAVRRAVGPGNDVARAQRPDFRHDRNWYSKGKMKARLTIMLNGTPPPGAERRMDIWEGRKAFGRAKGNYFRQASSVPTNGAWRDTLQAHVRPH